jgi:hypothetical protein
MAHVLLKKSFKQQQPYRPRTANLNYFDEPLKRSEELASEEFWAFVALHRPICGV